MLAGENNFHKSNFIMDFYATPIKLFLERITMNEF